ncbi:MAG TPA: AAA family ATPase, partial [Phaeodactylibacter sp.]|nr:AAA family ATPase [Phaeodactylibacter sp.]
NFYSVIKDSDPYIRMDFITGVSKFSRVSIFSDLNNLDDLSLQDYRSDTLFGYTQEELEHFFSEHIAFTAPKLGLSEQELIDEIRRWYNGYSWNGVDFVYNPFSVLSFFQKSVFRNYWFATATPTFLINLIKEKQYYNFNNVKVGDAFFEAFQIDNDISVGTLLFQTGYLTIKEYDAESELYTLAFPNREVKKSMLEHLLGAFAKLEPGFGNEPVQNARRALQTEDFELLKNTLNEILYNIPYRLYENKERVYHLLIHIFFDYIGLDIHSEVNTARGRADVLVELDDKVYAIEFKIDQSAQEALNQIKERGYLDKYRSSGKKLIAMGINFSTEKREVEEFAVG